MCKIIEEYGDERAAEAFKKGEEVGIARGEEKKAIDAAITLIQKYKATPEDAAKDMNAPFDKVQEALKKNNNPVLVKA